MAKATQDKVQIFVADGGTRYDRCPQWNGCVELGDITRAGGTTRHPIYCRDPYRVGGFKKVGEVTKTVPTEVSGEIIDQINADTRSWLLKQIKFGLCPDVMLAYGCGDPKNPNAFQKIQYYKSIKLGEWSQEQVTTARPGDVKEDALLETVQWTTDEVYEYAHLNFSEVQGSTADDAIIRAVAFADTARPCITNDCDDGNEPGDGCAKVFAGGDAVTGTPVTRELWYNLKGGRVGYWNALSLPVTGGATAPQQTIIGIGNFGGFLVIVSGANGALSSYPKIEAIALSDFDTVTQTIITNGAGVNSFPDLPLPNDPMAIWTGQSGMYIFCTNGYVTYLADPTGQARVLQYSTTTPPTDDFAAADGLNDDFVVGVGANGLVAVVRDGALSQVLDSNGAVVAPINSITGATMAIPDYTAIALKSEREWVLGDSTGVLYFTTDGGRTIYSVPASSFQGSGQGEISDLVWVNSVIYASQIKTGSPTQGRIWGNFYDGGCQWKLLPAGNSLLPNNQAIHDLAICDEGELLIAVGENLAGTGGTIIRGADSLNK